MLADAWQVQLFGKLQAHCGDHQVTRFRTQKAAGLLAFMAHYRTRSHSREQLVEQFWPDVSFESGRNSLKQELASLRRQLEPPGFPAGSVLVATRLDVHLNPDVVETDTHRFESQALAALTIKDPAVRAAALLAAASMYAGDLLPGHYEDWVLSERRRLADLCLDVFLRIAVAFEETGDYGQALNYMQQAITLDPFHEENQARIIRMYIQCGKAGEARQHFSDFEKRMLDEFGEAPSPMLKELVQSIPAIPRLQPNATVRSAMPVHAPLLESLPPQAVHRLPIPLTRFFGREEELSRLGVCLMGPSPNLSNSSGGSRLLTISGPGGVGKTRLALELASRLSGLTNVWFVQLAEVADPANIASAVLDALGIHRSLYTDAQDQVFNHLLATNGLLVLDNYEHLAEGGAMFVAELLHRVPTIRCLITSRQHLELVGEQVYTLRPLLAPEYQSTPQILLEFASVQLFVDRAQAVRPDFQINPRNSSAIAAICNRLEGIPLAIELAAAWSGTLSPAQILTRLDRRFEILVSRKRDVPERQRSLAAAIDGSFRLLPQQLQQFFAQLSVFRGGCSLDAVEAIVTNIPGTAVEALSILRERSLIYTDDGNVEIRFHMLESLREFAWEQLSVAQRLDLSRSHVRYFTEIVYAAFTKMLGEEQSIWFSRIEADMDNLRAAMAWSRENDVHAALVLTSQMWHYWVERSSIQEGMQLLSLVLSLPEALAPTAARARALFAMSQLLRTLGNISEAIPLMEENLSISRALDNRHAIASTLNGLGNLYKETGDLSKCRAFYMESLLEYSRISDKRGIAAVKNNQGLVEEMSQDLDEAKLRFLEAQSINHETGNKIWEAGNLINLGNLELNRNRCREARQYYEDSLKIQHQIDNRHGVSDVLMCLADASTCEGNTNIARELLKESLDLARELKDPSRSASALISLAELDCTEGSLEAAAGRYLESLELLAELEERNKIAFVAEGAARIAFARNDRLLAAELWAGSGPLYAEAGRRRAGYRDGICKHESAMATGDRAFLSAWENGSQRNMTALIREMRMLLKGFLSSLSTSQ